MNRKDRDSDSGIENGLSTLVNLAHLCPQEILLDEF